MKETAINISEKIAGLKFDQPALEASFAREGKSVEPDFDGAMRRTLGQYAELYGENLAAHELLRIVRKLRVEDIESRPKSAGKRLFLILKKFEDQKIARLTATRKAFELVGQSRVVLDVEVAVASNYIMQGLGNK